MDIRERIAKQMKIVNARRQANAKVANKAPAEVSDGPSMSIRERLARQNKIVSQRKTASDAVAGSGAPVDDNTDSRTRVADRIATQKMRMAGIGRSAAKFSQDSDQQLADLMKEYQAFAANVKKMAAAMMLEEAKPAQDVSPVEPVQDAACTAMANGIATEDGEVILKKSKPSKKKASNAVQEENGTAEA